MWSACEFWQTRGLNDAANHADTDILKKKYRGTVIGVSPVEFISITINGGYNGMDDRKRYYARAQQVLVSRRQYPRCAACHRRAASAKRGSSLPSSWPARVRGLGGRLVSNVECHYNVNVESHWFWVRIALNPSGDRDDETPEAQAAEGQPPFRVDENGMPRKSRIGATGELHHVIVRGIERRKIFYDDEDRDAFVDRFSEGLSQTHATVLRGHLSPTMLIACFVPVWRRFPRSCEGS